MERETPNHEDLEVDEELVDVEFNLSEYVTNLLKLDAQRSRESTKKQKEEERIFTIGDEVFPTQEADEIKVNPVAKELDEKKAKKKKKFLEKFRNSTKLERRKSFGVIPTFSTSSSSPILKRVQQSKSSGDETFFRNQSLPGFNNKLDTLSDVDSFDSKSLSLTDFESDMDNTSYVCFSEFENESRPLYLRSQKNKFKQLILDEYTEVSRKEWNSYHLWLKQVVKSKLEENEVYGGAPSVRLLIFLHFYRLEIPMVDITPENIASEIDWRKKSRFIYNNVASFIEVPLDSSFSPYWWCNGSRVPKENYGSSYIIHIRQTYSEERRLSKNQERRELKQQLANAIMIGEPISVFSSPDPKKERERELFIRWLLRWITSQATPHQLRVSCCKTIVSLVYPEEIVPGLVDKIWNSGVAQTLLTLAANSTIEIPDHVELDSMNLEHCIDRGAAGKVFLGNFKGKNVAAKICTTANVAFRKEEFLFEASLMCILRHPCILPCIAANLQGKPNFILVSPYQEKGSLRKVLRNCEEKLSWSQKVKIALEIAKGMDYLHKQHLVHRDLKSPNILVNEEYEISITDFATTRFINRYNLTQKESFIGTTEWMAPEMITEGKDYDQKVDVYSFGILLYEIFTREIPYSEMKTYEIVDFVLGGGRPDISEKNCPYKFLINLTQQCWHSSPKKRPSFSTIVAKLNEYLKRVEKNKIDSSETIEIPSYKKDTIKVKNSPNPNPSPLLPQDNPSPMGFLSFAEDKINFDQTGLSPRKINLTKNYSSPRLLSMAQNSVVEYRNDTENTVLDCSDLGSLSISEMINGEVTLGHSPRPFSSPICATDDSRYF